MKYNKAGGTKCTKRVNGGESLSGKTPVAPDAERTGDSEDLFGRTKCYATDPSKIQMGWTVRVKTLQRSRSMTRSWHHAAALRRKMAQGQNLCTNGGASTQRKRVPQTRRSPTLCLATAMAFLICHYPHRLPPLGSKKFSVPSAALDFIRQLKVVAGRARGLQITTDSATRHPKSWHCIRAIWDTKSSTKRWSILCQPSFRRTATASLNAIFFSIDVQAFMQRAARVAHDRPYACDLPVMLHAERASLPLPPEW